MSLQPELPFEFIVAGTPVSLQGSATSQEAWKERIRRTARRALPEGAWLIEGRLEVTIFLFPAGQMQGDIDNCAKPILDALGKVVYFDDRQIDRLVLQRFEPDLPCQIVNPSKTLVDTIGSERPVVYIRIDEAPNRERAL